ncbi:MAG: EAL domain-containing protein [Candidatus Omnitrophica bacterium]|nr:EAL domain-containing protein [Candidatus Omnitrophota bacterium]
MPKTKHKILVVTDDPSLRAALAEKLSASRFDLCYSDGEVMQKVFDEVPHLVVIDEGFKRGEGLRTALAIKRDMVLKYVPVALLAARRHALRRRKTGLIDLFFERPPEWKNFLLSIRRLLAKNYNELDLNPLTNLPGARSSLLRIERAIASRKRFAVCCADLSHLGVFNKVYGDARGDKVIARLAKIIQRAVKEEGGSDDFVGHLGGDDFIVVTHPHAAEGISRRIAELFDEAAPRFYDRRHREEGHLLERSDEGVLTRYPLIAVSIAVVQNGTRPLSEITEISAIASDLQRCMKKLPGSRYMEDRRQARRENDDKDQGVSETAKSVRIGGFGRGHEEKYRDFFVEVLEKGRIETLYQPIVDLRERKVIGFEAMTRGFSHSPLKDSSLLFAAAREYGKIQELDELCVEHVLKSGQGIGTDKKLFLNLNHETLITPGVMKRLFRKRGAIGLKSLVIEITEESILRSFQKIKDALFELKKEGVSVAIDDVGGGAVSLRDVAILKPDYMKFDRSLIRQIHRSKTKQQIVRSMLLFASGFHALTAAEGIETKEECQTAAACGVHLGQGYYFARPGKAFPEVIFH